MAWIVPKTTWGSPDVPVPSDFNRIEGNTLDNHDSIIAGLAQEVTDRNAAISSEISSALSSMFSTGTYTPTATNGFNTWNYTTYATNYYKIDDYVHVSGHLNSGINTPYDPARLYITLPIASAASGLQLSGLIVHGTSSYQYGGFIYGSSGKAVLDIGYPNSSSISVFFEFTYQIV